MYAKNRKIGAGARIAPPSVRPAAPTEDVRTGGQHRFPVRKKHRGQHSPGVVRWTAGG